MIDHFERVGRKRLGDVLVDEKLIPKEQLNEALGERERSGMPLGQILIDSDYLSEWDLAKTVAAHYNLPYLDLLAYRADSDVIEGFPGDLAHREHLMPFDRFGDVLCLACAEMPDVAVLRRIQEITGCTPCLFVGLGSELRRIIGESYDTPDDLVELPTPEAADLAELIIDEGQREGWERIFDLANDEVLNENPGE